MLENDFYQKDVNNYIANDEKNIKTVEYFKNRLHIMKKYNILMAAKLFDLHKDQNLEKYSIGQKEFEIQRVSLLQKHQGEFVLVDNSGNPSHVTANDIEALFNTSTGLDFKLN